MTRDLFLLGGGRGEEAAAANYALFLDACGTRQPRVGCVVVDEGDGDEVFHRFAHLLTLAGNCEPVALLIHPGVAFDTATLAGHDALFVCGGLTPAYAAALTPAAPAIRDWLISGDRPYAGFSAGAAIAATRAVVGGWLLDGVPICHEDCAEDLDELSIVDGLGLTSFAIDVHCAQWGTLSRLVAAVSSGAVTAGIGLDEDTMLTVRHDSQAMTVTGLGHGWLVTRNSDEAVDVRVVGPGQVFAQRAAAKP
jgi:cyanophycinase